MSTTQNTTEALPELATRAQVAAFTQLSLPTLARWAAEGTGPKFVKLGGAIRYRRDDVLSWIRGHETGAR